jgi:hypothetical protein
MYSDIVEYNHHLSAAYNNKECKEVVVAAEEVYCDDESGARGRAD